MNWIGAVLALCVLTPFAASAGAAGTKEQKPENTMNVVWTAEAWRLYEQKRYEEALGMAGRVIRTFGTQARGIQIRLMDAIRKGEAKVPPVGAVAPPEEAAVHKNGLLNDVATCFFITGKSDQELYARTKEARFKDGAALAFANAAYLTLARCWDPNGRFFWNPSEGSLNELANYQMGVVVIEVLLPDGKPAKEAMLTLLPANSTAVAGEDGAAPLPVPVTEPVSARADIALDGVDHTGSSESVRPVRGQLTRLKIQLKSK
jgi:hypothetical protein